MWIWIAFSKLILNIFLRSKNRQSLQPMYQISQGIFKDVKIKQYIYFTDQPETLNPTCRSHILYWTRFPIFILK